MCAPVPWHFICISLSVFASVIHLWLIYFAFWLNFRHIHPLLVTSLASFLAHAFLRQCFYIGSCGLSCQRRCIELQVSPLNPLSDRCHSELWLRLFFFSAAGWVMLTQWVSWHSSPFFSGTSLTLGNSHWDHSIPTIKSPAAMSSPAFLFLLLLVWLSESSGLCFYLRYLRYYVIKLDLYNLICALSLSLSMKIARIALDVKHSPMKSE